MAQSIICAVNMNSPQNWKKKKKGPLQIFLVEAQLRSGVLDTFWNGFTFGIHSLCCWQSAVLQEGHS